MPRNDSRLTNAINSAMSPTCLKETRSPRELLELDSTQLDHIRKIVSIYVPQTPIARLIEPSGSRFESITVKFENQTPSGSFKIRGVSYFMHRFQNATRQPRPLFAASTGNHGISLAILARNADIPTSVVVPKNTPPRKIELLRHHGAKLIESGDSLDEALIAARNLADIENGFFLDSSHCDLLSGNSSLGAELFEQASKIDFLFFPIGVGAGISSLLLARRRYSSTTKVIGVVPESSPAWFQSWSVGRPVSVPLTTGLADGLRTVRPDANLFSLVKELVHEIVVVSDTRIKSAETYCLEKFGTKAEPTGVVGLAGLLEYGLREDCLKGSHAATILCAGQVYSRPKKI